MLLLLTALSALAAPPTLIVRAEPLGTSDDRTATSAELTIRAAAEPWIACFPADPAPDAGRFLSMHFRVRPTNGTVFGAKLRERTGDDAVDACALGLLKALVVQRTPMYPDHIEMTVTWAVATGEAP
jgi:hypothetical protein